MKKLKKMGVIVGLFFTSTSFSFYPMKMLCFDPLYLDDESSLVWLKDKKQTQSIPTEGYSFFLYEENNHDILEVRKITNLRNPSSTKIPSFLTCDFKYEPENVLRNKNFFSDANKKTLCAKNLFYRKLKINFIPDNIINKETISGLGELKRNGDETGLYENNCFEIAKEFTSKSGVLIKNTDKGVILSKGEETRDLTSALRRYT